MADIQIYARPIGTLNLDCPVCGHANFSPFPWRRANVRCKNGKCWRTFRVGLGFSSANSAPAILAGRYNGQTINQIDPQGTNYAGISFHGTIEWKCPVCSLCQASKYTNERLECCGCGKSYFINILIYKPKSGDHLTCPFDFIVPKHAKQTTQQPIDASASSEGAGKAS